VAPPMSDLKWTSVEPRPVSWLEEDVFRFGLKRILGFLLLISGYFLLLLFSDLTGDEVSEPLFFFKAGLIGLWRWRLILNLGLSMLYVSNFIAYEGGNTGLISS
jgi:hypothetical protein